MTLWLYYRKSIDKMVLLNDNPSKEWSDNSREKNCELYVGGKVSFQGLHGRLIKRGHGQDLVSYAMGIEPGDIEER